MEAEDFRKVATEVAKSLPEISNLFEINLGDPKTFNEIVEKAKEALVIASIETVQHAQEVQSEASSDH